MSGSPQPWALAITLIVAFSLAGIAQVIWLRSGHRSFLARAIDGGRTFRGRRLFGDNKTWRGFVVMVPATACAFLLLVVLRPVLPSWWADGLWSMGPAAYALTGAVAGLGFMLGELPNSFVKRQLGIAPGLAPEGFILRIVFAIADRVDSILGMLIVLSLIVPVPMETWFYVLLLGPAIHFAFSATLHAVNVKPRLA